MLQLIPAALAPACRCLLDRHEPEREHVRWDGADYTGNCRHCRNGVRRDRRGFWRKDWLQG